MPLIGQWEAVAIRVLLLNMLETYLNTEIYKVVKSSLRNKFAVYNTSSAKNFVKCSKV